MHIGNGRFWRHVDRARRDELEVHRDARGTKLVPGDEIHFGRAVVVFEVGQISRSAHQWPF